MTNIDVSTEEARVISVLRAIKKFNHPIVDETEVGDVVEALKLLSDLSDLEQSLSGDQLTTYIDGFVAGYGALRLPQIMSVQPADFDYPEGNGSTTVEGGPTGGVVAGQLTDDSRYIKQTGPKEATKEG